jgi:hypothetical protein
VAPGPEGPSPHSRKLATDPILIQLNPLHPPPMQSPKIYSNPIIPSTPQSSEWSLSFGLLPPKPCTLFSPFPCVPHATPTSFPRLDLPNDIFGWVQVMKFLTLQLPPSSCHFTSSVLGSVVTMNGTALVPTSCVSIQWQRLALTYKIMNIKSCYLYISFSSGSQWRTKSTRCYAACIKIKQKTDSVQLILAQA